MARHPRYGQQKPRYLSVPRHVTTAGPQAVELVKIAGRELLPWQANIMNGALGRKSDGSWSAPEVLVAVGRQNGKGDVLMARELFGLFILGEKLIIHSAHEVKTANEAFRRILGVIKECPFMWDQVARVDHSKGEEGIELKSGARLRFMARTKSAARGFGAPCLILDEAFALTDEHMAAIAPTMLAQKDPQIWFASSHGMVYSTVLARMVKRGRAKSSGLAAYDWSVDLDNFDLNDRAQWFETNPSLGHLIKIETLETLRGLLGDDEFTRECLGVGQYPEEDGGWEIVPKPLWEELTDRESTITGKKAFAIDVTPDRSYACISVGGLRADGKLHGEVTHHGEGTAWLPEVVKSLKKKWKPVGVFYASGSPAASLDLKIDGLTELSTKEVAKGCGSFVDECTDLNFVHRDDPRLNTAIAQAKKKEYADGSWFISRKSVEHDMTPINSVILALYGVQNYKAPSLPMIW